MRAQERCFSSRLSCTALVHRIEGERVGACSKLNVRWAIVDINSSSHAGEQLEGEGIDGLKVKLAEAC